MNNSASFVKCSSTVSPTSTLPATFPKWSEKWHYLHFSIQSVVKDSGFWSLLVSAIWRASQFLLLCTSSLKLLAMRKWNVKIVTGGPNWSRVIGPTDRLKKKGLAASLHLIFRLLKIYFESLRDTTLNASISCPLVCISDVISKAGISVEKGSLRHEPTFSTLHWALKS